MQNTYVVHAKGKNECLIIDAGMYTPGEQRIHTWCMLKVRTSA